MITTGPAADRAVFRRAEAVADAILYEGYLLYPYRRSSAKNRFRWQFGVLAPRAWAEAQAPCDAGLAGSAECWWQQTECLVETSTETTILARVRFLQLQRRAVRQRLPGGGYRPVSELRVGPRHEFGFDEAVPRHFDVRFAVNAVAPEGEQHLLRVPGGRTAEPLTGERGTVAGLVVRTRWPVIASVDVSAMRVPGCPGLRRLRLRITNTGGAAGPQSTRDVALRHALLATHSLLAVDEGSFLSMADPPEWARQASQACCNVHTFPVLAGPDGEAGAAAEAGRAGTAGECRGPSSVGRGDLVLSAPIILPDHPKVAPESPGDLHDATEIDELLSLRTLAMTDGEKREARATDARAAAILDRVEAMPPEVLARLHGAIRSLEPAGSGAAWLAASPAGRRPAAHPPQRDGVPWWDPGGDASVSPQTDSVIVAGQRVARGSRVRLRPRRSGADPHDMFLAGRTALVEAVLLDVDGSWQIAVTVDGDPGAELNQWYGRFRHFAPEEVEPLPGGGRR